MKRSIFILAVIFFGLSACKEDWDEHYNNVPETVNQNMWEVIKADSDLSSFVQYMEEFELDTLFEKGASYSLFIPDNQAIEDFLVSDTVDAATLMYHISLHFVQSVNISGLEKIQMMAEKFAYFERYSNNSLFDGIPITKESPLYINGKYFVVDEVAEPKPNLFEYFALTNPILESYILDLDSIILDKELSRPLGFDEDGNTVYDSVKIIYNEFEEDYFPVREEYRYQTATIVFPKSEDYNLALDEMANTLGAIYQDHTDIPMDWQNDILIPYLLEHGVFENSLSEVDFIQTGLPLDSLKLKNILGDSIVIDYQVSDKLECSNGIAFNYKDFVIPDTLYKGSVKWEAEWFLEETGVNKFTWYEDMATEISSQSVSALQTLIPTASNDSIMYVDLGTGFSGTYSVEFKIDNLFPRKYLMVVRTNRGHGGIWDVYLNDQLIRTMDYGDYFKSDYRWFYYSVSGGKYFAEDQGYHYWDAWAQNDAPYGEATLRFEFMGEADAVSFTELFIDYIEFIPYDE